MTAPVRLVLLRSRIVAYFFVATLLLVGVVAGSFGLLWQWNMTRLADTEEAAAQARWAFSLQQVSTFYEAVGLALAQDPSFVSAVHRLDRQVLTQLLQTAMGSPNDIAPIVRIDLALSLIHI